MAAGDVVYRTTQARLHRVLGNYLAIIAWKTGSDCIVLERSTLLKFLDLTKMKNARIDWLKEDLQPLFPECHTTNSTSSGVYATLYLSRVKIPDDKGIWKSMTTKRRIEALAKIGIRASAVTIPKEEELIKKMALTLSGLENL